MGYSFRLELNDAVLCLAVDVECLELSMKIKLYPAGTFNGVVYVPGARATARCSVTPTGNSTTPFDITVDDPACGAVSGLVSTAFNQR